MPKARSSEAAKALSKMAAVEDIDGGLEQLRSLLAQVEDMSREGFPYRDAVRARTELALRETIRQIFGEKSPEYQTHKIGKPRASNRTHSMVAVIKQLMAQLEQTRSDLLNPPQEQAPSREPLPERSDKSHLTPVRPAPPARAAATSVPLTPKVKAPGSKGPPPDSPSENVASSADASVVHTTLAYRAEERSPSKPSPSAPSPADPAPAPASPSDDASRRGMAPPEKSQKMSDDAVRVQPPPPGQASPSHGAAPSAGAADGGQVDTRHEEERATEPALSASADQDRREAPPPAQSEAVSPIKRPEKSDREGSPPATLETQATLAVRADNPVVLSEPTLPIAPIATSPGPPPSPLPAERPSLPTAGLQPPPPTPDDALETLRTLCARFHAVARQLRIRHDSRATLEVEDEYDVQDLLCALLHLHFGQVDSEDWCPGDGSETGRRSFHLHHKRVTVAAKKTRAGVTARDLAEQVKRESARHSVRGDCRLFLCFIYDPEGRIGNPRGFESDLTTVSDSYTLEVIVAPK